MRIIRMKIAVIFIFITLSLSGCKRQIYKNSLNNTIIADTVATTTMPAVTPDTIIKTSRPFELNNAECYWTHLIINNDEIIIRLQDSKTDKILLDHLDNIYYPQNYNADNYFDEINKDCFEDVNSDGFTDILIKSYSSAPMNDMVNIYLFNKETKAYDSSELSNNRIELVDKKGRRLITSNEYRFGIDSTIYYFDKAGKVKFTEEISNYRMQEDTTWIEYKEYRKVVNGETIIERTTSDTIKWDDN